MCKEGEEKENEVKLYDTRLMNKVIVVRINLFVKHDLMLSLYM